MSTTPSAAGIDAAGISRFLDRMQREGLELHSIMIARHGDVVAQGWWQPYRADQVNLVYSLSKAFTASCVGSMVDEGLIDIELPVVHYLPEINADHPHVAALTVRNCLNMATGHTEEALPFKARSRLPIVDGDPVYRQLEATPPQQEPGTVFAYNQVATYLLGAIVRTLSGRTLLEETRRRILDPLEIGEVYWDAVPGGGEMGFSGIHVPTEAILKLGQLYLGRGEYRGQRILSEAWVDAASTSAGLIPAGVSPDWAQGYGFQLWMGQHGYRGDGACGQYMLVLPDEDMVVAITSEVTDMQAVLDGVWEEILPAVDAPGSAHGDAELADRLARLELQGPSATMGQGESQWPRGGGDVTDNWTGIRVAGDLLTFDGVDVTVAVSSGWALTEIEANGYRFPVATSGGWRGDDFVADVRFLHTPHTMRVRAQGGSVELSWRVPPLGKNDPLQLGIIPADQH